MNKASLFYLKTHIPFAAKVKSFGEEYFGSLQDPLRFTGKLKLDSKQI